MAANNTVDTLNTTFKYVQKELMDLIPNSSILFQLAKHSEGESIGRKYLQPVTVSGELGITYGDGGGYTYNDSVAATYEEAEVESFSVVLKSRISGDALDRMKGDKSTRSALTMRGGVMKNSLMKFAEIDMLYGRFGIGNISGSPSVSTDATITITDATWAPGIWSGMIGMMLDCYNGASKINTNADLILVSVNHAAKQIVVSGNGTDLGNLANGYTLFPKGAKSKQMYGLHYQLDNATTLFGIDAAAYDLWKASEYNVAGALTVPKILAAVETAQSKGGLDEDFVLVISSKTFQSLASDILPLRVFDQSYKPNQAEVGSKEIRIHTSAGVCTVMPHPFCMQGYGYAFPDKRLKKIGPVAEVSFNIPGKGEVYFEPLEGSHAIQMLGYYNFQVFMEEPAKCVLLYGITN